MKLSDLSLNTIIITEEGRRLRIVGQESGFIMLEIVGRNRRIKVPSSRKFSFYLESDVALKTLVPKPVYYSKGYSKVICEALLAGREVLKEIIDKAYDEKFGDRHKFAVRVMSKLYDLKVRGVIKKEGKHWKLISKDLLRYRQ